MTTAPRTPSTSVRGGVATATAVLGLTLGFGTGLILSGGWSPALFGQATPNPAVPNFAPPQGLVPPNTALELSVSSGAPIWYTVDGTVPVPERSPRYSQSILLSRSATVRARTGTPARPGPIVEQTYVIAEPALIKEQSILPQLVLSSSAAIAGKGFSPDGVGLRQVPRQRTFFSLSRAQPRALDVAGQAGLRNRGAGSTRWKAPAYSFEAWDTAKAERSIAPLGMPKESDWVLYYPDSGPRRDVTLVYNALIWRLSASVGRYAPRFRFVELFLDEDGTAVGLDDRRGLYLLVEKVKRDADRLNFEKLSGDGKTGGWLLSINRMDPAPVGGWPAENGATRPQFFHTPGPDRRRETPADAEVRGDDLPQYPGAKFNFEHPSGYRINPAQRAAIERWFEQFEAVLYDPARRANPVGGVGEFIDDVDFIDYFLLNALAQNFDMGLLSVYPWRSSFDGRLRLGPTWDFNHDSYDQSGSPYGSVRLAWSRLWYRALFNLPGFSALFQERWKNLRAGPLSDPAISAAVDALAREIGTDAAVRQGLPSSRAWCDRLARMKLWLRIRARWMDRAIPHEFKIRRGRRVPPELQFCDDVERRPMSEMRIRPDDVCNLH